MLDPLTRSLTFTATALALALGCGCGSGNGDKSGAGSASAKAGASTSARASNSGSAASGSGAFKAPDPAKLGKACKSSLDCPEAGGYKSACRFECEKPSEGPEKDQGYCRLKETTGAPGASPCVGNRIGPSRHGKYAAGKEPLELICDVNAGVYCDEASKACQPVKATGATCQGHFDCGKDGICDKAKKVCIAAPAAGEPCADVSEEVACASTAVCDRTIKKCVARVADGAPCKEADQCLSSNCVAGNDSTTCRPNDEVPCPL